LDRGGERRERTCSGVAYLCVTVGEMSRTVTAIHRSRGEERRRGKHQCGSAKEGEEKDKSPVASTREESVIDSAYWPLGSLVLLVLDGVRKGENRSACHSDTHPNTLHTRHPPLTKKGRRPSCERPPRHTSKHIQRCAAVSGVHAGSWANTPLSFRIHSTPVQADTDVPRPAQTPNWSFSCSCCVPEHEIPGLKVQRLGT